MRNPINTYLRKDANAYMRKDSQCPSASQEKKTRYTSEPKRSFVTYTPHILRLSVRFKTIGWMKVLAVKGIEKQGHLWAVRYTRHHGRNVQDAIFFCDTPDAAKAKYRELLDRIRIFIFQTS